MIKKPVTIQFQNVLDARPAAMLVQVASKFQSEIFLESGNKRINAKSIMGVMTIGTFDGDKIMVYADGPDENEAVSNLENYLTKGCSE